ARMVFASLYNLDVMPFKDVLIHGLVRDDKGRKMSKSLGNGVDPLEIIDQYGADALRFMLISGNTPGNDQRFQMERVEAARNFANKLWNASRFVMMGVDSFDDKIEEIGQLDLADKWILTGLYELSEETFKLADAYEYSIAASQLYEFIWNEYCDWYIELAKIRLYGEDEEAKKDVQRVLIFVLKKILLLLQPYMPFITQEIYSHLSNSVLMNETWIDLNQNLVFPDAKEEMELVMEAIKAIRNARQEMDIKPSKKAKLYVDSLDNEIYRKNEAYFKQLASVSEIESLAEGELLREDSLNAITRHAKLYIPADELIDYQKEFDRLSKDEKKLQVEIARIEGKLANQGFVSKAPAEVIAKEKEKLAEYQKMLEDTLASLDKVKEKL
ncbi:MAG: class I tRNA ligase family protein, partial [Bacillota bacterium]|nr:class I tRNA ligase family protein [Bacillota bacterium]